MNEYEYLTKTAEGVVWADRYETTPSKEDYIATYHHVQYARVDFYVGDRVVLSVKNVMEVTLVS